jgi:HlyD family secretion protein
MKKIIVLLILLAALAAAGYYFVYPRFFKPKPPATQIRLSGNIEAHESVLSFKVQGRIVELPIEEGQWANQDALLARLDGADYRQQVRLDEATVKVRDAELALANAGSRTTEIKAYEQSVLDAKADMDQKKLDFDRAEKLQREDAVSQQARDAAETSWKRAQAAYERARQNYEQALEGTRKEQIQIAQRNVSQAQQNLQMSQIRLGYTALRAPLSGVVLIRQAELGEVVAPGTPVVTLGDLDHVWLRAYVSETDLGRVRWGQEVRLTTDSYPGKIYRGRISFISSQAEFTPKSVQTQKERVTLVYRIKIDLENPNHELKPGMPADAVLEAPPR